MKLRPKWLTAFFCLLIGSLCAPLEGAYILQKGKLISENELATGSAQEHYGMGSRLYQEKNWTFAAQQFEIVLKNFPESPFYQEALFYFGACQFEIGEYEKATKRLSAYLRKQAALPHFREAVEMKFKIAELYRLGAKKHLMGLQGLPKWIPAYDEALEIYDEVISALPNDPLAAEALFGKGCLLVQEEEFSSAIETLQTMIRRFPRHALTPEGYVEIAKTYLKQTEATYPDVDQLELAELSINRFRQDFPTDARIAVAEESLRKMYEIFGSSLYEIGQFFERTKKPQAAKIYYTKIIHAYPQTKAAALSEERLGVLRCD